VGIQEIGKANGYSIISERKLNSSIRKAVFTFAESIFYFCVMETNTIIPVTLTEGAIAEIRRLMEVEGFDTAQKLRVGVKGGGCSGMTYLLGFDQVKENDNHFEIDGIPCIMEKAHEIYLHGMLIDWQDGLNNRGFTFKNPNASNTCGCGTSFAV
jgi:iron-sulfur cluster assembly accessory protein